LEQEHEGGGSSMDASLERVEILKAHRLKLQHAMERLIDGFTEGLIEKEQFTRRMDKTKNRIADLDARIKADAGDVGHVESLRLAMKRLQELSTVVGTDLAEADWHHQREIIRTLVQKIEIDTKTIKIIFRLTQNAPGAGQEAFVQSDLHCDDPKWFALCLRVSRGKRVAQVEGPHPISLQRASADSLSAYRPPGCLRQLKRSGY
jgi:site-specific DNA recombinase